MRILVEFLGDTLLEQIGSFLDIWFVGVICLAILGGLMMAYDEVFHNPW